MTETDISVVSCTHSRCATEYKSAVFSAKARFFFKAPQTMAEQSVCQMPEGWGGEFSAALRYDGGRKVACVRLEGDNSWRLEAYEQQNGTAWRLIEIRAPDRGAWLQAIQEFNQQAPNPFINESEYNGPSHDQPVRIFVLSDADNMAMTVVCCRQSVHIWTEDGTYRVHLLRVEGSYFAFYNGTVFVSHAAGIFYLSLSDGIMDHLAVADDFFRRLRDEHGCIEELAVNRIGIFAVTVNKLLPAMPCIVTFLVEREGGLDRIQELGTYEGDYSGLHFSSSRPDKMIAIEHFPRPRGLAWSFAPVTLDFYNLFNNAKVTGRRDQQNGIFRPTIVGISDTRILIYSPGSGTVSAYDGAAMTNVRTLPMGQTRTHLLGGEIMLVGNRQEATLVLWNRVLVVTL